MSGLTFSPVGEGERPAAFATLVSAFVADPVMRWLYPELAHYQANFPALLAAAGGNSFDAGSAWRLGEFSAVALWIPPGTEAADDPLSELLTQTVPPVKHGDLFSLLDQMDVCHPKNPHWYLPWFGVHATLQGNGLGSELMRACLKRVDADRLPAYLETPNPRNIPFYERHGFEVIGVAEAGECPPVSFMLRAAS